MPKLKIKLADYLIIAVILCLALGGVWLNLQTAIAAERKYAVIYVNNRQIAELSLSERESYLYTFNFGVQQEHTAIIEVQNGRIRMLPLDDQLCPRAICSHTGWITYSYESIVCLPNQIMIVFTESTSGSVIEGIDGMTY